MIQDEEYIMLNEVKCSGRCSGIGASDKVYWYGNDYHNDSSINLNEYKYIAVIHESSNSYGEIYVSNNLRQLKSFVLNSVRQGYTSGSGAIYFSYDKYFENEIYQVWYNQETWRLQIRDYLKR